MDKKKVKEQRKIPIKKQLEEITDTLKRVQADFINYQNRVDNEFQRYKDYANCELMKRLLPILDSFELALKNSANKDEFEKGIRLIYKQLQNTLHQEGLCAIECNDKKFDPHLHEVMLKSKSEKESDTIIEELQRGYTLKDRVLRHSKVKIAE